MGIDKYQKILEGLPGNAEAIFKQYDPFRIKLERLVQTTQKSVEEIRKIVKDKNDFIY
jgi:hypothetical protein